MSLDRARDIEEKLRYLESRRSVLEKRIQLRESTLAEFSSAHEKSIERMRQVALKQNEAARARNRELLNSICAAEGSMANRSKRAVSSRSSSQLEHAKKSYLSFTEKLRPYWREQQTIQQMGILKQLQREKESAETRRERTLRDMEREHQLRVAMEQERRQLLLSLSLEQRDALEATAQAEILREQGRAVEEVISEEFNSFGEEYQRQVSGAAEREATEARHTIAPLFAPPPSRILPPVTQRLVDKTPPRLTGNALRATDSTRLEGRVEHPSTTAYEDSEQPLVSTKPDPQRPAITSPQPVGSKEHPPVLAKLAGSPEQPPAARLVGNTEQQREKVVSYSLDESNGAESSNAGASGSVVPAVSPARDPVMRSVSGDSGSIKSLDAPRSDLSINSAGDDKPEKVEESKNLSAPAAVTNQGMAPNQDTPIPATPSLVTQASSSDDIPLDRNMLVVSADRLSAELPPRPPRRSQEQETGKDLSVTDESKSTTDLRITSTMETTQVAALLQAVCSYLENMDEPLVVKKAYFTAANDANSVPSSEVMNLINDHGKNKVFSSSAAAAAILILKVADEKGSYMLPSDLLNGVVSVEKVNKSHKKMGGHRAEVWTALTDHMRRIIESKRMSQEEICKIVTSSLVNHIDADDRSRVERKVLKLVQLAVLPPEKESHTPRPPVPPPRKFGISYDPSPTPPDTPSIKTYSEGGLSAPTSPAVNVDLTIPSPARAPNSSTKSKTVSTLPMSSQILKSAALAKFQVDDDEIEDDDGFEAPAIVMRDLSEQQDDDEFDF
mmetsp:Transcript_14403/g.21600  ORF Transcript_14403/g.21600 Transcript_14403/m.21600 type:complete len:785 (+) Transcript_14403:74-2428(+)|eukprot:CAMPEP_0185035086 /NCGR_PEP_ID=MMETSP1103-20130426/25795_1 /TAXON_ID=36769 /ORGANISM="Paraphysomonas bandaiensis, Strain Caron Lab Isolate" /LENGTH=784 /DNA_ID=CAMNT_0027572001 /DNA_START=55 /DNA_END=2409 /DNA_ORIENTATION=-